MKNTFLKIAKFIVVAMVMMVMVGVNADDIYATDASVTVSSATVEEGSEVSVTVTVSSADKMAAYNLLLTYDANMLEYVSGADGGGNGAVKLLNELFEDTSVTRTLVFKAKKAGTVAVNVDTAASSIIDMQIEDCNVAITNGSVTVNAKVTSSANNYLSSLEVVGVREDGSTAAYNITQRNTNVVGFNKDELKYMAYVANDIVKFAVTAVPEDATATVAVNGVELVEGGANATTITVTAQNGEVREYIINTYRVPSETEAETPSEPESETEPGTEPGTTPAVDKEVTIGADVFVVTNISEDVVLPEGFSTFEYTYEGQIYIAAKGEAKKLTIMQLVKKGTEEKALYVYDENGKIFYKFVNIQITNKMYTVTDKPEDVKVPEDFEESLLNIDGEMLNIWVNKNDDTIYLFYGMNWNGESGWYLYDSKEKTAMRYVAMGSVEVSNTVTPQPDSNNETTSFSNAKNNNEEYTSPNIVIMIVEAVIILVLVIVMIIILKKKENELEDELEDDFYGVKTEDVAEVVEEEAEEAEEIINEEIANEEIANEETIEETIEETEEMLSTEEFSLVGEIENIMEDEMNSEELDSDEMNSEETDSEEIDSEEEILAEAIMEEEVEDGLEEKFEEEVEDGLEEKFEEVVEEKVKEPETTEELELVDVTEEAEEIVKSNISIEEMLSDSSTSLNEDELDMVLDKLLGDE